MARKQTSAALSSLAAKVLSGKYFPTRAEVLRLAACVLSQVEGSAK
jgi:hypothetical protein